MPKEIASSPRLQAAFKRIIELKLERHWTNWEKQGGFMSFGLVQLGQAATSLGDGELAYRCLVPLVNRYWYNSLASTHNYKKLFNTDISGGMPAVIIKMLVASDAGVVRLLPARPAAWPAGAIEGVLCRGQIEVKRLQWDGRSVHAVLRSAKRQAITLVAPAAIAKATAKGGAATSLAPLGPDRRTLLMPAGTDVVIDLELK